MREVFINSLLSKAKSDKNIILVTGDLGFGVLDKFAEDLPEQFINAGVAEQNMTGLSAGLALEGYNVFTYSIGNFPTLRCLEQIRNDIIYHNLSVNIIAVGGGLSYGALGVSHHAIEDISIMRTFPNIQVFAPCDEVETLGILNHMLRNPKPSYLRLDKFKKNIICGKPFVNGDIRKIRNGNKVAIIGYGSILEEALIAHDNLLNESNINCSVYSAHTLKPINKKSLINIATKYEVILALEEHMEIGGLGSLISEILIDNKIMPKNILKLNLKNKYSNITGSRDFLRNYYQIDSKSIISCIKNIYKNDFKS